jgi:hypothetical protein
MRKVGSIISTTGILRSIVRLLAIVIIFEFVVLAIVGVIGWRMGWSTVDEFAQALQFAGMLIIGLGLFGIKGNWDSTRSFEYQYSLSVTEQSSSQRTQQTLVDFAESYRFMIVMFFVGFISILIGWLI